MSKLIQKLNDKIINWWCLQRENFFYEYNYNLYKYENCDKFILNNEEQILLEPIFLHNLEQKSVMLFIDLNPEILNLDETYYKEDICLKDRNFNKNKIEERITKIAKIEREIFHRNVYPSSSGAVHDIHQLIGKRIKRKFLIEHIYLFQNRSNFAKQTLKMLRLDNHKFDINSSDSDTINLNHALDIFKAICVYLYEVRVIVMLDPIASEIIYQNLKTYYDFEQHIHYFFIDDRKIYIYFEGILNYGILDNSGIERLVKTTTKIFLRDK